MNSEFSNGKWTVWIGGAEVNDYPVGLQEAQNLANQFISDGYQDTYLEQVKENS
jgi:hypothetical protein